MSSSHHHALTVLASAQIPSSKSAETMPPITPLNKSARRKNAADTARKTVIFDLVIMGCGVGW